jgi:quercetin dioxygenase-like cupin family protein
MLAILMLFAMLFQAGAETPRKPVISNDRVVIWDSNPATAQPLDAVVVSLSGDAVFVPKGTPPKTAGRSIVIDLKDHPVPPIENTSGYPLAFPRPGVKKLLENERVIVWDYTWEPGVATPMHFHDKDVVVIFLEDGELKSTTPDGQDTVTAYTSGTVRFNTRNRTHTETLVRGKQRAIIAELK